MMDNKLEMEMINNRMREILHEKSSIDLFRRKNHKQADKVLKIDKRLPQIIVPADKIQMFIDWWNSDIRFEKSIPHTFDEGYMIIDNIKGGFNDISTYADLIKTIAKTFHTTYRDIENQFKGFIESSKKLTLYFKFTSENAMFVETYDNDDKIISNMEFAVGENSEPEKFIEFNKVEATNFDDVMEDMNFNNLAIMVSCLWYIATTTRSTRYIYENKTPVVTSRNRGVVQVSDTKFITTPIYDMKKVKVVTVEKLTQRKKGWTYSHSFEVHGHYRHYKDGKVVFIKPFIKGKDKDFKAQKIIVKPENG